MSLVAQRIAFSLATIAWGVCCVYFYASGRIVAYLAEAFRIYSLLGGLALCVLGLFTLLTAREAGGACCSHDHSHDDEEEHDHESSDMHPAFALIMMIVPLFLCVSFTKDSFSQAAIARKADAGGAITRTFFNTDLPPYTLEYVEKTHERTDDGFLEMPLLELYFGRSDEEMRSVLAGLDIVVEGRLMTQGQTAPNELRLYRLFITCCVADSRPIPAILRFNGPLPEQEAGEWMSIKGTLTYEKRENGMEPVIAVQSYLQTAPPYEELLERR